MRELYDVMPYVLPSPQVQIRWEIRHVWENEEPSKLWKDHIDSVTQFQVWKAEHPHDGAMTSMYQWAPVMFVGLGLVGAAAGNPLMIAGAYMGFCQVVNRWSGKKE